ncbi:MAG: transglycosylase domain-containing protein [Longimicrobiales bacterium]
MKLLAVILALIGAAWFYFLALPWGITLRWREPQRTAMMQQRLEQAAAAGEALEIEQAWVPLERISPALRRAVVVAEDGRFYEHSGVDWQALREEFRYGGDEDFSFFDLDDLRALRGSLGYYRANRDRVRGRSTITQQVAKNLYFSTHRSVLRKLEELIVAKRLERLLSKDRILEVYLNIAEWGPGIFGAEAAARHHFGRSAAELTRHQAAQLAASLPHPLRINPSRSPGRMAWRVALIEQWMGGTGPVETVPLGELEREAEAAAQDIELDERLLGEPAAPEPDTTGAQPTPEEPTADTMSGLPTDTAPGDTGVVRANH